MDDYKFSVFILSHGRADNVKTWHTLRRQGYTGDVRIIIDNEDAQGDEYRRVFGDRVITFDKARAAETTDYADLDRDRRIVVFARNAVFEIARDMELDYFLMLDDDYSAFVFKWTRAGVFKEVRAQSLDRVFAAFVEFLRASNSDCIAMAQNGDFFGGGLDTKYKDGLYLMRKCMNTFFCATENPLKFGGRVNEDVVMYCDSGNRGARVFAVPLFSIIQETTQAQTGGLTDTYIRDGTYIKSFYPVLFQPSFVTIRMMGEKHRRIHHRIAWGNAVPCIISPRHRKTEAAHE